MTSSWITHSLPWWLHDIETLSAVPLVCHWPSAYPPSQRASDSQLWYKLKHVVEQTIAFMIIWDDMTLVWRPCNFLSHILHRHSIQITRHWPLCGEFTGDRWLPRTNDQLRGKCFHLMTSSCYNVVFVTTCIYFFTSWVQNPDYIHEIWVRWAIFRNTATPRFDFRAAHSVEWRIWFQ